MDNLRIKRVCVGLLGTNCYVLHLDGRQDCLIIDPGAEPERIRQALEGRTLAAILLTHGHFDHIGALDDLMSEGTELAMHAADAPMLSSPEFNACELIGRTVICRSRPTRLVQDGDTLLYAGIALKVLHTPGHTPGGVCYECGNHIFTGDTLFTQGYGRCDLPGGSEMQLMRSLRRLSPLQNDHTIYGGHGA